MRSGLAVVGVVSLGAVLLGLGAGAAAQGTKQWTTSRYDEMDKGTTEGVAIGGDGRLEAGPATSLLYEHGGKLCVVGGHRRCRQRVSGDGRWGGGRRGGDAGCAGWQGSEGL